MDVHHDDRELEGMELNPDYQGVWQSIAERFRRVMNIVRQAKNEVELHNWKGLRLEKLKGKRSHQHSMRLNDQWRLIVEFISRSGPNNNLCSIKSIEDYH